MTKFWLKTDIFLSLHVTNFAGSQEFCGEKEKYLSKLV